MRVTPELVTVVAVASIVAYGLVAYPLRARARRARPPSLVEASGLARWLPYFVWVPYVVIALRPGPEVDLPGALRWAGLALTALGPLVSIWSAVTLGRHFDLEVEVHGGHEVVRRGPYGVVRHPIYAGLLLHYVGTCLATGNLLLVAGTAFVTLPGLWWRARAEERLLREQLGDPYDRYAREVGMLVPFVR
jgi:protein-S-isoprenylcysteine O-methyltransferase Ste14